MKKFIKSFSYAFNGIEQALKQRNFKVQLSAAAVIILSGIYFNITSTEWLFIITAIFSVLIGEMINSAIEETCNTMRDSLGAHYNATKIPRDIAAGAVLLASIFSILVALIIFLPKILF